MSTAPQEKRTSDLHISTWHNCYGQGWKGILTESSFCHPAKYSKSLIFKIIDHAIEEGFIKSGDTVCDPFSGIGSGGLPCGLAGVHFVGVELESRFCAFANGADCGGDLAKHEACPETGEHGPHHLLGNLELWQRKYGTLPQWVQPTVLQGDSRELGKVLKGIDCCVASPPYAEQDMGATNRSLTAYDNGGQRSRKYGSCSSNLGNLPPGSVEAALAVSPHISVIVSSPPYANGCTHTGGPDPAPQHIQGGAVHQVAYGEAPGNLGNLPAGSVEAVTAAPDIAAMRTEGFAAVVSSPPYEGGGHHKGIFDTWGGQLQGTSGCAGWATKEGGYGLNPANMGNTQGQTFWEASRIILEQVYALLKPGGHAIWVLKPYIRDKAIVNFPGHWRALSEHVGFVTLHEHHALLVDSHSEMGLFGEEVEMYRRESKSFFRRLAEKAGAPEINAEIVLCMRKPAGAGEGMIDSAVSSPPYNLPMSQDHNGTKGGKRGTVPSEPGAFARYGNAEGQLEGLPPGDIVAVISSPPYVHSVHAGNGIDQDKLTGNRPGRHTQTAAEGYGADPGQLAAMRPGDLASAIISSPPYAGAGEVLGQHNGIDYTKTSGTGQRLTPGRGMYPYGTTPGQLGALPPGEPPSTPDL